MKNSIALLLIKFGLWVMDLQPRSQWDDGDFINYNRLKELQGEFQSALYKAGK